VPSFQLVLQFRGASIQDVDEVLEVEDALIEMLGDREELAGHDIGERVRNIFIATDDPDATFRRLMPFLERAHLLEHLVAAARPVHAERYRVLWPPDRSDRFSLG
jgi:hypothetical protein